MDQRRPDEYFDVQEKKEQEPQIVVTRIADGLGFGGGNISKKAYEEDPDNPFTSELQAATEAAIESPEILVTVDVDDNGKPVEDDGCGDGRGVVRVFKKIGNKLMEFKRSLRRAKVFGGGLTMGVSARIGLGMANDKQLEDVFSETANEFTEQGIDFGGHTANFHVHDGDCGCGAIDKAPEIIQAAVAEEQNIRGSLAAVLGQETYDDMAEDFDGVFANYAEYAPQLEGQQYRGERVSKMIDDKEKVQKELDGPHREAYVILNMVEGYTVDQELVRRASEGRAQAFAVDVWRLKQIADDMSGKPEDARRAFASMLVYTLATAAVLTKGDQPVYAVATQTDMALVA